MMRYVILIAMLLCLPVRGEAWQVVGVFVGFGQGGWVIEDDFSVTDTDPLEEYTEFYAVGGTPKIENGTMFHAVDNGMTSYLYHSIDLGTSSQVVEATLNVGSSNATKSGLVLRANGTTGHYCSPNASNNRFDCAATGGAGTSFEKTFPTGAWHLSSSKRVRISVGSNNIYRFEVDWNGDGDFDDTSPYNEQVGNSAANSSYTGTKVGVGFTQGYILQGMVIGPFKAKVYTP